MKLEIEIDDGLLPAVEAEAKAMGCSVADFVTAVLRYGLLVDMLMSAEVATSALALPGIAEAFEAAQKLNKLASKEKHEKAV